MLVRHGETVDNANRIMQGQTQGQLNETGIRQAEEVAISLAGEHVDDVLDAGDIDGGQRPVHEAHNQDRHTAQVNL